MRESSRRTRHTGKSSSSQAPSVHTLVTARNTYAGTNSQTGDRHRPVYHEMEYSMWGRVLTEGRCPPRTPPSERGRCRSPTPLPAGGRCQTCTPSQRRLERGPSPGWLSLDGFFLFPAILSADAAPCPRREEIQPDKLMKTSTREGERDEREAIVKCRAVSSLWALKWEERGCDGRHFALRLLRKNFIRTCRRMSANDTMES